MQFTFVYCSIVQVFLSFFLRTHIVRLQLLFEVSYHFLLKAPVFWISDIQGMWQASFLLLDIFVFTLSTKNSWESPLQEDQTNES